MRAPRAKKSDVSGLTLIELLAVILIAGILAAMSVPTFNAILKGTALRTASKALTDTFSLGRQFAIMNRYVYRVELVHDPKQLSEAELNDNINNSLQINRYRIYFVKRSARWTADPTEADKVTVRKWRWLPKDVEFDDTNPPPEEIVFKPTGGAYERTSGSWPRNFWIVHTKQGTSAEKKAMIIKVGGITGRATAEPPKQ